MSTLEQQYAEILRKLTHIEQQNLQILALAGQKPIDTQQ
jgi:hypothetical protein